MSFNVNYAFTASVVQEGGQEKMESKRFVDTGSGKLLHYLKRLG